MQHKWVRTPFHTYLPTIGQRMNELSERVSSEWRPRTANQHSIDVRGFQQIFRAPLQPPVLHWRNCRNYATAKRLNAGRTAVQMSWGKCGLFELIWPAVCAVQRCAFTRLYVYSCDCVLRLELLVLPTLKASHQAGGIFHWICIHEKFHQRQRKFASKGSKKKTTI